MLVTFSSKAYSDITMFGDVALSLLKMMGRSAKVPGAILAEDVPAALNRLTTAIAELKAAPPKENIDQDGAEPAISMNHRALPLINLLTTAAKEKCNVMWE